MHVQRLTTTSTGHAAPLAEPRTDDPPTAGPPATGPIADPWTGVEPAAPAAPRLSRPRTHAEEQAQLEAAIHASLEFLVSNWTDDMPSPN